MVFKALPINYRKSPPIIASFDWSDVEAGVGYNIYYGATATNGLSVMTPNIFYSESVKTFIDSNVAITTFAKYLDIDFDLIYNLPTDIKGDVLINVPMGVKGQDAGDNRIHMYCIAKVIHYDGSTETELGTAQSITLETETLPTPRANARMYALKVNVSSVKHFKKGEILRIRIELWAKSIVQDPENVYFAIGHDPQSRNDDDFQKWQNTPNDQIILANYTDSTTFTFIPTRMEMHIPSPLDL